MEKLAFCIRKSLFYQVKTALDRLRVLEFIACWNHALLSG